MAYTFNLEKLNEVVVMIILCMMTYQFSNSHFLNTSYLNILTFSDTSLPTSYKYKHKLKDFGDALNYKKKKYAF